MCRLNKHLLSASTSISILSSIEEAEEMVFTEIAGCTLVVLRMTSGFWEELGSVKENQFCVYIHLHQWFPKKYNNIFSGPAGSHIKTLS